MKTFIEKILHKKVNIEDYKIELPIPLYVKMGFEFYNTEIDGLAFIIMTAKEEIGIIELRAAYRNLEKVADKPVVIYLKKVDSYTANKLLEEGIAFIVEGKELYMPFLGILLKNGGKHKKKTFQKISYVTQKFLLLALYNTWQDIGVTEIAKEMKISKMTASRVLDEIETFQIADITKTGRRRSFTAYKDKRKMWEDILPYLRNPLKKEYYVADKLVLDLCVSGISALSKYSLLSDNSYITYAATKTEIQVNGIKNKFIVPYDEHPGCIVQELGYIIDFNKHIIDPLTIYLLLINSADERIQMALDEMLEEYVW